MTEKVNWFAKTEKWLYDYKHWPGRIKRISIQLEEGLSPSVVAHLSSAPAKSADDTSEPERLAIKRGDLEKQRKILEMQLAMLDAVLNGLTAWQHKFVYLRYWRELSYSEIQDDLQKEGEPFQSERTLARWRKKVVFKIARELGFIEDEKRVG